MAHAQAVPQDSTLLTLDLADVQIVLQELMPTAIRQLLGVIIVPLEDLVERELPLVRTVELEDMQVARANLHVPTARQAGMLHQVVTDPVSPAQLVLSLVPVTARVLTVLLVISLMPAPAAALPARLVSTPRPGLVCAQHVPLASTLVRERAVVRTVPLAGTPTLALEAAHTALRAPIPRPLVAARASRVPLVHTQ